MGKGGGGRSSNWGVSQQVKGGVVLDRPYIYSRVPTFRVVLVQKTILKVILFLAVSNPSTTWPPDRAIFFPFARKKGRVASFFCFF